MSGGIFFILAAIAFGCSFVITVQKQAHRSPIFLKTAEVCYLSPSLRNGNIAFNERFYFTITSCEDRVRLHGVAARGLFRFSPNTENFEIIPQINTKSCCKVRSII